MARSEKHRPGVTAGAVAVGGSAEHADARAFRGGTVDGAGDARALADFADFRSVHQEEP